MKTTPSRHRRILGETAWVFFGQGMSAIATLVGLRLITELVSPDVYGTVALALGVVLLAHGLAVGPLMQAVLRYYPDVAVGGGEHDLRRAALTALRRPLFIALAALVMVATGWSVVEPEHAWLALLSATLFLAEAARSVEITFLNAARRQRAMALLVIADAWLRPVGAVVMVWVWGAHGAAVMAGYLVGAAVALLAYWAAVRSTRRASSDTAGAALVAIDLPRRLRTYARPLTALPLIGWVSGQADRYLVGGLAGLAAAGVYAALYGLASKPFLMLASSIELALRQPYYARVSAADHRGAHRVFAVWLASVLVLALATCSIFVVFHAEIASVLLAAEYRSHSALMGWIAAGYVLLAAAQVFERVCYAYHDTAGVLGVQAAGALLSIAIAAPLVWRYGIEGAAWAVPAYFGAQLLLTLARAAYVWQRARPQDPALARPHIAGVARP